MYFFQLKNQQKHQIKIQKINYYQIIYKQTLKPMKIDSKKTSNLNLIL